MALAIVVTAGASPKAGSAVTLSLLRRLGLPAISISGTIGGGDISPGAITTTHITPGAYFYSAGIYALGTYAVTLAPALTGYANGVECEFKADTENTGTANADVNALGAKPIYKHYDQPLAKGDIRANQIVRLVYNSNLNGGSGGWQMQSPGGNRDDRFQSVASTGTDAYVITCAPTLRALNDGARVRWKVPNANTTAVTVNVDGLGAKSLKKFGTAALELADLVANQIVDMVYESTTDTWQMVNPPASADLQPALIGATRNLKITNNAGAPNNKLDITADEIIVKSSTRSYVLSTVSVTVDLTASGANGLDTGAEGSSTFYYVWAIYNPATGTTAGLLSASSTAPTLPSGYTAKALIGVIYNNSGSNFITSYQLDRRVWINETNLFTAQAPAVADTYESISVATLGVPSVAKSVLGSGGTSDANPAKLTVAADANGLGAVNIIGNNNGAASNNFCYGAGFEVPLKTAQTLFWKSPAGAHQRINISGFTL